MKSDMMRICFFVCLLVSISQVTFQVTLGVNHHDGYIWKRIVHGSAEKNSLRTMPCTVKHLEAETSSKLMLCLWNASGSGMSLAGYNGSHCIGCPCPVEEASLTVANFNSDLHLKQGELIFLHTSGPPVVQVP